jgi:hypothetical protein
MSTVRCGVCLKLYQPRGKNDRLACPPCQEKLEVARDLVRDREEQAKRRLRRPRRPRKETP